MGLVPAICTQCGASIEVNASQEAGICPNCNTAFVTEKVIANINISTTIENATIVENVDSVLETARQMATVGSYEDALTYYCHYLMYNPSDWEVYLETARICRSILTYWKSTYNNMGTSVIWVARMEQNEQKQVIRQRVEQARANTAKYYRLAEMNAPTDQKARIHNELEKLDSDYMKSAPSGCYIATYAYGGYDCPQLWTFRRYRDTKLIQTTFGRFIVQIYYTLSSFMVNIIGDNTIIKYMLRAVLERMVNELQKRGYENTPYTDV